MATAGYTGFLVGPPAIGLVSAAFGSLRAGLAVVALLGVATALLAGQARWGQRAPHVGDDPGCRGDRGAVSDRHRTRGRQGAGLLTETSVRTSEDL